MITGGGHHDNVSPETKRKEHMAKTYKAPWFIHLVGVTADSSLEEFERAAVSHPLFVLERK